jgi:hypothetical protein
MGKLMRRCDSVFVWICQTCGNLIDVWYAYVLRVELTVQQQNGLYSYDSTHITPQTFLAPPIHPLSHLPQTPLLSLSHFPLSHRPHFSLLLYSLYPRAQYPSDPVKFTEEPLILHWGEGMQMLRDAGVEVKIRK